MPPAPTSPRRLRRVLLLAGAALFLYLLTRIPYDILRQERFRAYGEYAARAVVESVIVDPGAQAPPGAACRVVYNYVDDLGRVHRGASWIGRDRCRNLRPDEVIRVHVARARPGLSRADGSVEPPFQAWLGGITRGGLEANWP